LGGERDEPKPADCTSGGWVKGTKKTLYSLGGPHMVDWKIGEHRIYDSFTRKC